MGDRPRETEGLFNHLFFFHLTSLFSLTLFLDPIKKVSSFEADSSPRIDRRRCLLCFVVFFCVFLFFLCCFCFCCWEVIFPLATDTHIQELKKELDELFPILGANDLQTLTYVEQRMKLEQQLEEIKHVMDTELSIEVQQVKKKKQVEKII